MCPEFTYLPSALFPFKKKKHFMILAVTFISGAGRLYTAVTRMSGSPSPPPQGLGWGKEALAEGTQWWWPRGGQELWVGV